MADTEFLDTKIIPRRKEALRAKSLDITKTVEVAGNRFGFQCVELYEGALAVFVPDNFAPMKPEAAKMKYPSEHRPQTILTNEDGTVNMVFNYIEMPMDSGQVEPKMKEMRQVTKRMNPAFVFLTGKVFPVEHTKVAYFDYKSYALDMDMYNLVFVTELGGNLLMGSFNCPYEHYKDWKRLALQMVRSMEDRTQKDVQKAGE